MTYGANEACWHHASVSDFTPAFGA